VLAHRRPGLIAGGDEGEKRLFGVYLDEQVNV
jgi:hypothetical protein